MEIPWAGWAGFEICAIHCARDSCDYLVGGGRGKKQGKSTRERERNVSLSCLGVHNPSLGLHSDEQQTTEWSQTQQKIREKQQPSLGTSQNLRIQDTVILPLLLLSASCCPRNRDGKSGEDSVFLQAHRADLRKIMVSPDFAEPHLQIRHQGSSSSEMYNNDEKNILHNLTYLSKFFLFNGGVRVRLLPQCAGWINQFSSAPALCVSGRSYSLHSNVIISTFISLFSPPWALVSFHATVYLHYIQFMPLAILRDFPHTIL